MKLGYKDYILYFFDFHFFYVITMFYKNIKRLNKFNLPNGQVKCKFFIFIYECKFKKNQKKYMWF